MNKNHLVLAFFLIVACAATTQAQPADTSLTNSNSFQVAFGMSFYGFDGCGDKTIGEIFRKALLEKFDHCPFTPEAQANFHKWANDQTQRYIEQEKRVIAEKGKLPDKLDGMKMTCKEQQQTEAYKKQAAQLLQYSKGEIGSNDVIPQSCNSGAEGPPAGP